jgi:mevalonate kinase
VILLGEHAVVHGEPAIAIGLPERTRVEAIAATGPTSLEVAAWGCRARVGGAAPADVALARIVEAMGSPADGVALCGETRLPPRSGLGASASVAAAAARALAALADRAPAEAQLRAAVDASERVFHGNPSGLDAAAVLEAGVILFTRAGGVERLEVAPPPLVVVRTREPGDTRVTVAAFAARLSADPEEGRSRLGAMGAIARAGVAALERGDLGALGRLMDENQAHLAWFGVSSEGLDRACAEARAAGALGAKLTGGGGGGCAVALVRPADRGRVEARLIEAGFELVPP